MTVALNLAKDLQNLDPGLRLGDIKGLADAVGSYSGATTENAITASTTQTQAGGTILRAAINRITVANSNDAVTLPKAVPGSAIVLINVSGQTVTVFPFLGDKINAAAVNASVSIADATTSEYFCAVSLIWNGGATTNEA